MISPNNDKSDEELQIGDLVQLKIKIKGFMLVSKEYFWIAKGICGRLIERMDDGQYIFITKQGISAQSYVSPHEVERVL